MKKLISIALISAFLSFSTNVYAENSDKYQNISKSLVESYNKNDYKNFSLFFNKDVSDFLPEEKVKEVINSVKSQFGEIKEIKEVKVISSQSVMYPLVFEKGKLNLVLTFDKDDKIAGILFQPPAPEIKYPQINKSTTIYEIASPYLSQKENMGLAIGIVNKNGEIEKFFYGKTAVNKSKPDENTLFEIGSITKVFTTTALAQMVINKKVSLNDNLNRYVVSTDYKGKKIKLLDLATHRSALPRIPDDMFKDLADPFNPYANYSRTQMLSYLKNYKLQREPGKIYDYSNLGMGILGDVLATENGQNYQNFIADKIIKPLDMNNTTLEPSRFQLKNSATGHGESGEPVIMWDFASMGAAGAIKSDIKDMLKFLKANMELKNPELKEAMKLAQTPIYKEQNFEMGLGWHISKFNNDSMIWHNGGTGGFRSFLGFLKNSQVGVVVLSNSSVSVDELSSLVLKKLEMTK